VEVGEAGAFVEGGLGDGSQAEGAVLGRRGEGRQGGDGGRR